MENYEHEHEHEYEYEYEYEYEHERERESFLKQLGITQFPAECGILCVWRGCFDVDVTGGVPVCANFGVSGCPIDEFGRPLPDGDRMAADLRRIVESQRCTNKVMRIMVALLRIVMYYHNLLAYAVDDSKQQRGKKEKLERAIGSLYKSVEKIGKQLDAVKETLP